MNVAGMIEMLPMLAAEAEVRKAAGQKSGGKARHSASPNELGEANHDGEAVAQAAKLTGTNRQYVQDAKAAQYLTGHLDGPRANAKHLCCLLGGITPQICGVFSVPPVCQRCYSCGTHCLLKEEAPL